MTDTLVLTWTGKDFVSSKTTNTTSIYHLIGTNMAVDWGDGTSTTITANQRFTHTYSSSGTYTITITGDSITSLGRSCFYSCTGLTSITIPSGVTSLGRDCFYGCTDLTNITIPSSVTTLDYSCFNGCTGLTSITIPSNITSIGAFCFSRNTSLTKIIFKNPTPPTIVNSNAWTNLPTNCKIIVPLNSLSAYTSAGNYPNPSVYTYEEEKQISLISCNNKTVESIKTTDGGIIYEIPKLTLTSNKSVYEEGETATITAKCTDMGLGVSGQTVSYTGTTSTVSQTTDSNGEISFTKTMGSSSLTVPVTWSEQNITKNIVLLVISVSSINLSASKSTLSKSHSDSTILTATVLDTNNQNMSGQTVQVYDSSNNLIGTMTENNGTYSYTYNSQGNGDLTLTAKCNEISSNTVTVYDYLCVPPLNGTDGITKWTSATNNTSNGVFNSHGSYLSNGWDNSGLWQLDFDVRTSNWKYIGLMPVCSSEINPFTDAKVASYAMTSWEGISFFGGMGLSSWDNYPSNFSKITSTNTTYHITIKKLSSTKVEIHIGDYVAIGNYNNLPNHSTLYIGTRDNPSSRNYGGVPQLSNIVVKPLLVDSVSNVTMTWDCMYDCNVIVTVTDSNNNSLSDKTVSFYGNNVLIDTQTTNSNGQVTFYVDMNYSGNKVFKAVCEDVEASSTISGNLPDLEL